MPYFMLIFLFLIALPGFIVFLDFLGFLVKGKETVNELLLFLAEIGSLIVLPFMYAGFGKDNRCCVDEIDTTAFSPQHQLTILSIIALSLTSYIYSKFRENIAPPLIEVVVNSSILIGIILNIFISFHTTETFYALFGNLPVILLGILMLAKNQKLFIEKSAENREASFNKLEVVAWNILCSQPFIKFPILLIICLPILLLLSSILLLFGQKPDSIVRAFTDTYKHGFSQWDYKCANVECGGHYLCSVAAKGHKRIVRPLRLGVRNGGVIICNRQLLISNAFEDLIHDKAPRLHQFIRKNYNKVGNLIHRYYFVFNHKFISDIIYVLMKPLEWLFLLVLYTFDRKPENRIAKQYTGRCERDTRNLTWNEWFSGIE